MWLGLPHPSSCCGHQDEANICLMGLMTHPFLAQVTVELHHVPLTSHHVFQSPGSAQEALVAPHRPEHRTSGCELTAATGVLGAATPGAGVPGCTRDSATSVFNLKMVRPVRASPIADEHSRVSSNHPLGQLVLRRV